LVLLGVSRDQHLLAVMWNAVWQFGSSVRGRPPGVSGKTMKRSPTKREVKKRIGGDEILPEYDFGKAIPNKYASRYAAGSSVVVLEPDVAAAFPTAGEANEALRALAAIIQKHRTREGPARRSS
jgi:hypothetical protein